MSLKRQVEESRSAMQVAIRERYYETAAAKAFDGITTPLLAIARELEAIRRMMEAGEGGPV